MAERKPKQQPKHITNDPTSPNYFFHTADEDRNNPTAIQTALGKLNINDPSTFGGVSSADPPVQKLDSFITHTPPDVEQETHVVAVLGIESKWASPRDDGWFLSDFLAFWHLLNGLTVSQTWLHCLDLPKCVRSHERYLHGNPFKERKEVLNAEILRTFSGGSLKHVPKRVGGISLKKAFIDKIMSECKIAHEKGRNVLILMFGHGDYGNQGIEIGESVSKKTLKVDDFVQNLQSFSKARITILSTACFSGGWSCIPDLRALSSTMMAAGQEEKSRSWIYSYSFGRASGSMFTSAVVTKLTTMSSGKTIMDASEQEDHTEEQLNAQEETYADFCSGVYQTLLRDVDRRGLQHDITFSAQQDSWNSYFSQRVGIPLHDYQARWDALPVYSRDNRMHPGIWLNRDPHVEAKSAQEYLDIQSRASVKESRPELEATGSVLGKRKTSALYGGEASALVRKVIKVGEEYLSSYKTFDDTGDDGALHNLIRRIISGHETDVTEVERAWNAIRYRMDQMALADTYLKAMGIGRPLGKQCCEFDTEDLAKKPGGNKIMIIKRMIRDNSKSLFPRPAEEQGRPFYKGMEYVAAGLHYADLSKQQVEEKLSHLQKLMDRDVVEAQKNHVKRDTEMSSKRQKLYQVFDKALRSVSPSKRRSRGLSLTGEA